MSALERFLSLIDDEYEQGEFDKTVKAASACLPPDCIHTAPASIFDLATKEIKLRKPMATPGQNDNVMVVTRHPGGLLCRSIPFAESAEGIERERQRRARQIVPRPTRQKGLHLKNSKNWKQIDGEQACLTEGGRIQEGELAAEPDGTGHGPALQPFPRNA